MSLHALMTLQQQIISESSTNPDKEAFNRRLSRILTKLFARVIKAEESLSDPYSVDHVDMELLICAMEDILTACREVEVSYPGVSASACKDMVKSLVSSIVSEHGSSALLLEQMGELGIDSVTSELGSLVSVTSVDSEAAVVTTPSPKSSPIEEKKMDTMSASKDISALVSAVASAPQGAERDAAVAALRQYREENGERELRDHLNHVSSPFRAFIEDQLARGDPSPQKENSSMTERLRSLRSRLQEAAPSTAHSSPSKIPSPSKNSEALRNRLAAARGTESTATSRAAALRARLEAVKNMKR